MIKDFIASLNVYLSIFLSKSDEEGIRATLIKGSGGTFLLMILGSASNFIAAIILARIMGSNFYGIFVYATAWIGFLVIPAVMGMDRLLVRNIAAYHTKTHWQHMKGLIYFTHQTVICCALTLMVIAGWIVWLVNRDSNPIYLKTFWMALLLLPLISLAVLRQSILRGLHKVIVWQIPEILTTPLFIIIIASANWGLGTQIDPPKVIMFNILAASIAFGLGTYWLIRFMPPEVNKIRPIYLKQEWIKNTLPLMMIAGIQSINTQTDILMLGAFHDDNSVAIYSAARRGAILIIFLLQAANAVMAPVLSSIYTSGDMQRLQHVLSRGLSIVAFLSLPIALGMIILGEYYLMLFGTDFVNGKSTLVILSLGQLAVLTMSSAGMVLIMTGHERETLRGVGLGAAINVVMNVILIPKWGMIGAALATSFSSIVWSYSLMKLAHQKLGIVVFPVPFYRKRNRV